MKHITERITKGEASQADVDLLYEVANQIKGKCLCALGEFSIEAVLSGIDRFRDDFDNRVGAKVSAEEALASPAD
jgi:NADH-quinone oxidoreductase subunit F